MEGIWEGGMRWLVDVLVREGVWVGKGCSDGAGDGGVVVMNGVVGEMAVGEVGMGRGLR